MKKEILVALTALFLMSLSTMTAVYAGEEKGQQYETVLSKEMDLTGNNTEETVSIKGKRYVDDSEFFKELKLEVKDKNNKVVQTDLDAGFEPHMKIIDFNDDGEMELLIKVNTEDSIGNATFYLYTYHHEQLTNLGVPDPVTSTAQLGDNYEAVIAVEDESKEVTFDLSDNAKVYEKLGIYHNGKLNEPFELTVDSYSLLTPYENAKGEKGLKGVQRVTGVNEKDTIAYLESYWKQKDGQWQRQKVKVVDLTKNK